MKMNVLEYEVEFLKCVLKHKTLTNVLSYFPLLKIMYCECFRPKIGLY